MNRARRLFKPILNRLYGAVRPLLARLGLDTRAKYAYEALYWRLRGRSEGTLANHWYRNLFTDLVGLTIEDYADKRVLDIGCGPRGSLEWADVASRRVGLDPLVPSYRKLGLDHHAMEYVDAPAEAIPFPDGSFDVVTSINSLDHVDDVTRALAEMTRVLSRGGLLLIAVEVGHAPTVAEPHTLDWNLGDRLSGDLEVLRREHFEFIADDPGVSKSLGKRLPFDHADRRPRSGTLLIHARRS